MVKSILSSGSPAHGKKKFNIQLQFYGMTYLMILEKISNFNQFKNILKSWNGNDY
jgi:hypothetical protein